MSRRSPRGEPPRIISHYRIEKLLGSGAMGAVYLATDRRDRTKVALKLLHPHLTDESFKERFEREAHVGALLRSPYTVHLHDYGEVDGQYYLVMEYVDGPNLKDLVSQGVLDYKQACAIAVDVARALEEAQARGIVHRDIKPENILLRQGKSVKVTDFGIARQIGGGTLTTPGAFVGTLAYAAPEQFEGKTDHRSDLYAVGATLYTMLTGNPPFTGSLEEILRAVRHQTVDLTPLGAVPPAVRAIVSRCLQKDPADRFQSASELAGALEDVARGVAPSDAGATLLATSVTRLDEPATVIDRSQPAQPAPTAVQPPQTPSQTPTITMQLNRLPSAPIAGRLTSRTNYAVLLRNPTAVPLQVKLRALDDKGACRFDMKDTVTVPPSGTATARLSVKPGSRRWTGKQETHRFTIAADDGTGGGPPVTTEGEMDDRPFGWLPFGGAGVVAAVAAAAALLFVFASGSSEASAITPEQLPMLVLNASELGEDYEEFSTDPDNSGYLSNEDLIALDCSPPSTSTEIERLGRVTGYRTTYTESNSGDVVPLEPGGPSATPVQSGPAPGEPEITLVTEVELYDEPSGARTSIGSFSSNTDNVSRILGCEELPDGQQVVLYPVDDVGDEAQGLRLLLSTADEQAIREIVIVRFARSNVAATVVIDSVGGLDRRVDAQALAEKLDQQIEGALGAVSPSPRRTPSTSPRATIRPESGTPAVSGGLAEKSPDGTSPTPTRTPGEVAPPVTQAPGPGNQQPTAAPVVTPVPPPPTAVPTAAPIPVTPVPPPPGNYITQGVWTFDYYVTYNDCPFGVAEGTYVPSSLQFYETFPSDALIEDGETVDIYDQNGTYIAQEIFTYPDFFFSAPLAGGGYVDFYQEFFSPSSGYGARYEAYPTEDGECYIDLEE